MNADGQEHDVQSHMFRPTITYMQDKYCGDCYDIFHIQGQYAKVAAFGCHHKKGGAAFGRAISFVVSFVLALNRVNMAADLEKVAAYLVYTRMYTCVFYNFVAITTILALHVGNRRSEHV